MMLFCALMIFTINIFFNYATSVLKHSLGRSFNLSCDVVQDPGTSPAKRIWTSIDSGTEIFVSDKDEEAEWTLSDFDVILTQSGTNLMNKAERKK